MLKIQDYEIDFDITSPEDLHRYNAACAAMEQAEIGLPPMPAQERLQTRAGLKEYEAYITGQCRLLTDFIDEAFGGGTCNALLGPKTSLDRLLDVTDALRAAITAQGQQAGRRLAAYMPNRATRRQAKK